MKDTLFRLLSTFLLFTTSLAWAGGTKPAALALDQSIHWQRAGTEDYPLHVVLIDACFLPSTMDFLKDKHVVFEFFTSAQPILKRVFTPEVCLKHYAAAVGPQGKIVSFHSRFLGAEIEDQTKFKQTLNEVTAKRGQIHLVLANSSDLATYLAPIARQHLLLEQPRVKLDCPECFYDKMVMKNTLVSSDPGIRTAEFIAMDAPLAEVSRFIHRTRFPLILKKRRSAGAVGIQVIDTPEAFETLYAGLDDKQNYLVERFIKGTCLRIQGEKVDGKVGFYIPSFNRTSPLEHYKGGKPRAASTIDESEIPMAKIQDFTDRVLDALRMRTGTFHLEAIFSDEDHELYFMEIAARPGEGNMDQVYRDLHQYDAKRAFYFKQFPRSYFDAQGATVYQDLEATLLHQPRTRSDDCSVYAVLNYPFQDANRFTFQKVVSSLHPSTLAEFTKAMPTFKGCDFDESLAEADPDALKSHQGIRVKRYPFQAYLKAITCRFEGPREQLEADLKNFQDGTEFWAKPVHTWVNALMPRSLFMAGGL